MAEPTADQKLLPSVLDRLIDHDAPSGAAANASMSFEQATRVGQIRQAVKRDLEWLLNSKQVFLPLPATAPHLKRSS